jgi:hypothetical protein
MITLFLLGSIDCLKIPALVSDSGTKVSPLFITENRGFTISSVSYRNVSAALSTPK